MKAKVIFLVIALLALTTGVEAQNGRRNNQRRPVQAERRYQNNRMAPVRKTVSVLPYGYSQIRYNNQVYYYAGGTYYRPMANRYYEVVVPRVGMIVPDLPAYRIVRYNGRPYYAWQNHLYTQVRTPLGISFRLDIRR